MKVPYKRSVVRLLYVGISGNILLVFLLYSDMSTNTEMSPQDLAEQDPGKLQGFGVLNENVHPNENIPDIDIMSFKFSINPKNTCSWNSTGNKPRRVVVVVISKIDNFGTRYVIRKTWGSFNREFGEIVFLLGTTSDRDVQTHLLEEAALYNDVIQVNVKDAYNLLTFKSIAMLQWLYLFCPNADFYLKADDDTYINMGNIVNAIGKIQEKTFLFCYVFKTHVPIRRTRHKWFVPYEQFDGDLYPPYCSGTAYVFPSGILPDLYKSALTSKFIAMEDVFITGIAAKNLNISYIHSKKFVFKWISKIYKMGHGMAGLHSIHIAKSYDIKRLHSMFTQKKPQLDMLL